MAFPIIPIRNAVATSEIAPLSGALQLGELAINTQTSKLYVKNNAGTVVEIGAGATGITTAQLACLTTTATPNLVPQLLPTGYLALAQINALTTNQVEFLTTSAVAGLVPQLGVDGKIAVAQLPAAAIGGLTYKGAWTVNSSPVIASGGVVGSGTAEKGDYYIAANSAALDPAIDGQTYVQAGDMIAYNGAGSWDFIDGAKSEVRSVNSVSPTAAGNVVLTPADIGAVSTAQLTQLATAGGVPELNGAGQISTAQLQIATTAQLGVLSIDSAASNGLFISAGGAAKVIPGTSTVVGGVKSSASIEIDGTGVATVASAGTY
jgi:hypothetical protein